MNGGVIYLYIRVSPCIEYIGVRVSLPIRIQSGFQKLLTEDHDWLGSWPYDRACTAIPSIGSKSISAITSNGDISIWARAEFGAVALCTCTHWIYPSFSRRYQLREHWFTSFRLFRLVTHSLLNLISNSYKPFDYYLFNTCLSGQVRIFQLVTEYACMMIKPNTKEET